MRRSEHFLTAIIAATTSCASILVVGVLLFGDRMAGSRAEETPATTTLQVDRTGKSDALPRAEKSFARTPIATVEVVGVRDASIVYRDRNGNILFKTDPLANVTVVAKNAELPELTLRDTTASDVVRLQLEAKRPKPLSGCESAFARPSPDFLTNRSDRCLAVQQVPVRQAQAGLR